MPEKKKKKKVADEEMHENLERWLLTYADLITLLVAYFIMMYSMSIMNLDKFRQLAVSVRSGFGGALSGTKDNVIFDNDSTMLKNRKGAPLPSKPEDQVTGPEEWAQQQSPQLSIFNYVKDQLAVLKLDATLQPILDIEAHEGSRVNVILSDQIFFDPGAADLTEDSRRKLARIGDALKNSALKVILEGYSAPLPDDSPYEDSWQLSLERARAVADWLIRQYRLNPRRFTLSGYGEWKSPGKSRRLAMTGDGQWKMMGARVGLDDNCERVTISVLVK